MTHNLILKDILAFVLAQDDNKTVRYGGQGLDSLLAHYVTSKIDQSIHKVIFAGYYSVKVDTGDYWNSDHWFSQEDDIPLFLIKIDKCTTYKQIKELIDTPMNLTKEQAHILEIANKTHNNGEVNIHRALQLVNSIFSPDDKREAVYVRDARRAERIQIYNPSIHHYDIFTQQYWQDSSTFIKIYRKNGSFFLGSEEYISDDICFYCKYKRKWYYKEDYTCIVCEGDMLCLEANIKRVFLWSDGTYRYNKQGDDVPTAPERCSVSGYHCASRPSWWRHAVGIGMELEINCSDRDKLASMLSADILTERDGSLSDRTGVELIGGPYTCEDYQKGKTPWNETLNHIKKIGGEGHNAGTGYGIHLSISRSLFTTLHAAKFIVFFNQQSTLVKLVAQRGTIYSGHYGTRLNVTNTVVEKLDLNGYDHVQQRCNKKTKIVQTGKYEPVFADNKRLEVRVFRSNLRWERILKNVEFVQAVFDFTRDCGISVIADTYKGTPAFLEWLQRQNDFKTLKEFLHESKNKKSFTIDTTSVTNNTLLETFTFKPKTPQSSVSEQ